MSRKPIVALLVFAFLGMIGCGGGGGSSSPGASGPSITTSSLPDGARNEAYTTSTLAATGGTAPYSWTLTGGSLPNGLVLNSTGTISGRPTASGSFSPIFTVTDNTGLTGQRTIGINVVLSLVLFVSDIGSGSVNASVNIFDNANVATGSSAWTRQIAGGSTTLSNGVGKPEGQAYDNVLNILYVARMGGVPDNGAILAFDNANLSTTDNNVAPARMIQGTGLEKLKKPMDVFFDSVNDRLYVADCELKQVLVYDSASTLVNAANPNRTISGGSDFITSPPVSISVDVGRAILYVVQDDGLNLLVFDGASTRSDNLAADRKITISGSGKLGDVKVDAGGNLAYCTDLTGKKVFVIPSASTATGATAASPTLIFSLSANEKPQVSFLDLSNNRLFVSVGDPVAFTGKVLVFDNLSTLTGTVSPTRTLTGFTAPTGITGFFK